MRRLDILKCNCKDFKKNYKRFLGVIAFAGVHGSMCDFAPFDHCPWCGDLLDGSVELMRKEKKLGRKR